MENDVFKERETYMYLVGERWLTQNLDLVLFKHHCLNRFLHKVTYVKAIHKCTKTYKEKAPNQRKRYINVPASSSEVGHRFGALQAPVPH